MNPNLQQLRKRIDLLDNQIVSLLNRRLRLAQQVGNLKIQNGGRIYDPQREQQLLRQLCSTQKGPMPSNELRFIYQRILKASRNHQKRVLSLRH